MTSMEFPNGLPTEIDIVDAPTPHRTTHRRVQVISVGKEEEQPDIVWDLGSAQFQDGLDGERYATWDAQPVWAGGPMAWYLQGSLSYHGLNKTTVLKITCVELPYDAR